jgi:hypothetical protein
MDPFSFGMFVWLVFSNNHSFWQDTPISRVLSEATLLDNVTFQQKIEAAFKIQLSDHYAQIKSFLTNALWVDVP